MIRVEINCCRGHDKLHSIFNGDDVTFVHGFRGELEGEPRSRSDEGLSKRARILST